MEVNAQQVVTATLLILGAGFLFANARWCSTTGTIARGGRRPCSVWHGRQPPYFGLGLGMAVVLGVVIFYKIIISGQQAFGETMMFVSYGYLIPLSRRIRRGFYADGILVGYRLHPLQRGRRAELARGRALGVG